MNAGAFRNEISRARTFGFMRDVENLWKAGLALGASLDNTIALADDRIMNAEGLRYPQEFVRHKMLDAIGDLALAGAPMLGSYRSVRGGHRLNAHVVQALLADTEAWTDGAGALGARDRAGRCLGRRRPPSTTPPIAREGCGLVVRFAPVDEQIGNGSARLPGPIRRFLNLHQSLGQFSPLRRLNVRRRGYVGELDSCDRPAMALGRRRAVAGGPETGTRTGTSENGD